MTTLWTLLGALAVAYMLLLIALTVFQRRLLYRPDANLPPPAHFGLLGIEILKLTAADGAPLFAWYAKPNRPDGFVVLYLHGNGGHIGYRAERLKRMAAHGWGVFLLEYRGFGGNPGHPTEHGLRLDAQAGLDAVRAMGFPAERILLWGESLGTGLAIGLAAEHTVAAVLLESPYTSIARTAQSHYPYVPAIWLVRDRFDSLARMPRLRAPILIMQGALDRVVPTWMGKALMKAATAPVELWIAPQAGHNDLAPAGATEAAADFVSRHCMPLIKDSSP